jgi:hypothetical protein
MSDIAEITNVVARLLALVDRREWDALKALFTETVAVDYTSLFGGSAAEQGRAALVDGWAAFLPRFTAGTCHLVGTVAVDVDGDSARALAPVVAWHLTGPPLAGTGERWIVGGHYEIRLVREGGDAWRIAALTLHALWQEGTSPS